MPTPAELARAIGQVSKQRLSPQDVRPLRCTELAEEPTEFECRWAQRIAGRWQRFSTYLAIDGSGWTIIDWPPAKVR
jgi:hypothetical protein